MAIQLRNPTTKSDYEYLVYICHKMHIEERERPDLVNDSYYREMAKKFMNSKEVLIATKENQYAGIIIGAAYNSVFDNRKCLVQIIFYVEKEYRKSRVALFLLKAFEKHGRDIGCKEVEVACIPKNPVDFTKLGYSLSTLTYTKEL